MLIECPKCRRMVDIGDGSGRSVCPCSAVLVQSAEDILHHQRRAAVLRAHARHTQRRRKARP